MTQLDVYVENQAVFFSQNYKLHHMLRGLQRANLTHRVLERCQSRDPSERAFVHVDLTDVPPKFHRIHQHYAQCVNGRGLTISRLLYSTARLYRQDPYEGPVIVKTVLNSRGRPETRFKQRTKLGKLAYKIGGKWRGLPEKFKYCVYPSLSEVPPSVWSNPKLMVERFIPARLAPPITKHRFDFFYEVGLNARSTFDSLLCEPKTVMHVDSVSDIPDEVIAVRRALNLDYGAIDYFVTKDEVCVIDANKTVGVTSSWIERFPLVARHVEAVADRLIEFVRGS